jgi:hypothetical protein
LVFPRGQPARDFLIFTDTEDEASQTLGPYLIFRGLIPAPCSARSTAPIISKLRCPAGVGSAVTHRKGRRGRRRQR